MPFLIGIVVVILVIAVGFALLYEKHGPPSYCDHIYYPVSDGAGGFTGQECILCHKFNSIEDLRAKHGVKNHEQNS